MATKKKIVRKAKRKIPREAKLIIGGIGVIALLLIGIMVVSLVDPDEKEPKTEEPERSPHLYIDEVRFVNYGTGARSGNDDQTVKAKVFFTNDGEATSKNVKVEVFAVVGKNNMAEDEATVEVGDVGSMKTKKAEFELDLPRGCDYRIDLLVFEDGMITKKGYGTVKIEKSSDVSAQDFRTTHGENDDDGEKGGGGESTLARDEDKEMASSITGGLIISVVIVSIIVVVVAAIWYKKKRKGNTSDKKSDDDPGKTMAFDRGPEVER